MWGAWIVSWVIHGTSLLHNVRASVSRIYVCPKGPKNIIITIIFAFLLRPLCTILIPRLKMKLSCLLLPLVTFAGWAAASDYNKGVHWVNPDPRIYEKGENALLIACGKGYLQGKCKLHVGLPLFLL
jgi:hypothetical protein